MLSLPREVLIIGRGAAYAEEVQLADVGGGGLAFKLPGVSLSVEGRYNLGLANIMKDPSEGESLKNRSIMVLVGVGF